MKLLKFSNCKKIINIHPTFIIFIIFTIYCGCFALFLEYMIALIAHELCHFIVAKKCGYQMERIVLYPFGVTLYGETDEFSFDDEIKISLAGPILNLILSVVCVSLWWIEPITYYYLANFCLVNVVCFLFNILPVFPLDGGRVFLAILTKFLERKFAVKIVKSVTLIFAIILFICFIFSFFVGFNISFGLISVLLVFSCFDEDKKTRFVRVLNMKFKEKKLSRGIIEKTIVLNEKSLIKTALRNTNTSMLSEFKIVDNFLNIKWILNEQELLKIVENFGLNVSFEYILNNNKNVAKSLT